jgi:hypothetical protein
MTTGLFRPHGTFKVCLEGQILVQEVEGPWNLEMVEVWAASLTPFALQLEAAGHWAALVVYHGSLLTSPEAIQRMRQVITYSTQSYSEVACAVAANPEVEGYCLGAGIWAPVYEGLAPFQFFDDPAPAKRWLQAKIDTSSLELHG